MNLRSVAALACRILSIVALISVIQASAFLLPSFYEAFNPDQFPRMESPIGFVPLSLWVALIYLSPIALLLIFAGFLWMEADFVAAKMVGERNEKVVPISTNQEIQQLAFSVLGAYVLTLALPRLTQLLVRAWNIKSQDAIFQRDWTGFAPNLVYTFVEIALGLYLLFGARGLAALLADVRNLGRNMPLRQEIDDTEISVRPEK